MGDTHTCIFITFSQWITRRLPSMSDPREICNHRQNLFFPAFGSLWRPRSPTTRHNPGDGRARRSTESVKLYIHNVQQHAPPLQRPAPTHKSHKTIMSAKTPAGAVEDTQGKRRLHGRAQVCKRQAAALSSGRMAREAQEWGAYRRASSMGPQARGLRGAHPTGSRTRCASGIGECVHFDFVWFSFIHAQRGLL